MFTSRIPQKIPIKYILFALRITFNRVFKVSISHTILYISDAFEILIFEDISKTAIRSISRF